MKNENEKQPKQLTRVAAGLLLAATAVAGAVAYGSGHNSPAEKQRQSFDETQNDPNSPVRQDPQSNDLKPIYQPDTSHKIPKGGEAVPDGMQAPVGSTTSQVPGHPNLQITEYGTSPDGQTLPDRVSVVPATPKTRTDTKNN